MSAFASRLPESLQDAGLYCGVALAAYGVLASIWHETNKRRTIDLRKWLGSRIIEGRAWLTEWRKKPRFNPLLSVIVFLIIVTIIGAWLNNGKNGTGSPIDNGTERHASFPIVTYTPGSFMWEYEKTLSLLDAARQAYSETRTTFAAQLAEANDATDDQILLWYSYAIINFVEVWGERPPSEKLEPLNLKGFPLTSNTRTINAPIPGFSTSYIDLRVPKDDLQTAIEKIRAIGSKPEWAPTVLTLSARPIFVSPAPIPTFVRILFGPESVPPKEIRSQNVTWRAIEETSSSPKYFLSNTIGTTDPDAFFCLSNPMSLSEKCYITYKFLELVLSFQKPTTFKNIKMTAVQGGNVPAWTKVIMTETDAIIRFSSYPADKLLDIEATDEETNDQKK